jgi:hypothetical protein
MPRRCDIDKTNWPPTISEATGALRDKTKCRKQNQVVVESDAVSAESLGPESRRCADGGSDNRHCVDPVDLVDARVVLVGFEVGELLWREGRRHVAVGNVKSSTRVEPDRWRRGREWARLECSPALYMAPGAAAGAYAGVEERVNVHSTYRPSMFRVSWRMQMQMQMHQKGWRAQRDHYLHADPRVRCFWFDTKDRLIASLGPSQPLSNADGPDALAARCTWPSCTQMGGRVSLVPSKSASAPRPHAWQPAPGQLCT